VPSCLILWPAGIAGDERHQIGLAPRTGLLVDVVQMAFDGLLRDAEHRGNFGNAADLDDGEQHSDLRRSELELAGDRFRGRRQVEPCLAYEQRRGRRIGDARLPPRARGQGQNMGNVALARTRRERDCDAPFPTAVSPPWAAANTSSRFRPLPHGQGGQLGGPVAMPVLRGGAAITTTSWHRGCRPWME
jgi:hypothetical protein